MKKRFLIIVLLFFAFSIAQAQFESGNSLLLDLEKWEELERMTGVVRDMSDMEVVLEKGRDYNRAFGYVIGVFDAFVSYFPGYYFSALKNVSNIQVVDIAKKYLEEHPETRHKAACDLLVEAFKEAFPLKKENPSSGKNELNKKVKKRKSEMTNHYKKVSTL